MANILKVWREIWNFGSMSGDELCSNVRHLFGLVVYLFSLLHVHQRVGVYVCLCLFNMVLQSREKGLKVGQYKRSTKSHSDNIIELLFFLFYGWNNCHVSRTSCQHLSKISWQGKIHKGEGHLQLGSWKEKNNRLIDFANSSSYPLNSALIGLNKNDANGTESKKKKKKRILKTTWSGINWFV